MKHTTQQKGKQAEDVAEKYLVVKKYVCVAKNYRHKRSEIDLIMKLGNTLVFVEVKYRQGDAFGFPETFVSENQQQSILKGADAYIHSSGWQGDIRFDIVAVNARFEIIHFEDAFH